MAHHRECNKCQREKCVHLPHFGFCVKLQRADVQRDMNLNVAIDQHLMLPSFAAECYES